MHSSPSAFFLFIAGSLLLPAASCLAAVDSSTLPPSAEGAEELTEIIITAREPRYAAPTQRDRIGRIWAPVFINDQGPFRLVLDTGASHSAITAEVAEALQLTANPADNAKLLGVTGSAVVSTVRAKSLAVGDLQLTGKRLPIIDDAMGGAQGILGSEGLADKRVHIDFRDDFILIRRSRNERAPAGFLTIPIKFSRGNLPMVDAMMGGVRVTAVIDTGAQTTIANLATREALYQWQLKRPSVDTIIGTTADIQKGEGYSAPPILIGGLQLRSDRTSFLDLYIFHHWKLIDKPAVLIGMDALGLFDTLIIDYRRAELQVRMRPPDSDS